MIDERNIHDAVRGTKRTLSLLAAMYFAIGLIVSGVAVIAGDRLSAFLGLLIVGGALGAAGALHVLFRAVTRMALLTESLEVVRSSLVRIEEQLSDRQASETEQNADRIRILNLASVGGGDPTAITAAILDRSVFPRLVTTMGKGRPLAHGLGHRIREVKDTAVKLDSRETQLVRASVAPEIADKNLWLSWRVAMRNGDLVTCRKVYATLVDVADPATVADMARALEALILRHERRLRRAFTESVRAKDFDGALRVGAEICSLLPNRPLCNDFRRIKPLLERRAPTDPVHRNIRFVAST